MSTLLSPPPPFLPTVIGVNNQILPQPSTTSTTADLPQHRSASISSTSSSIIIVIIVIASAIIVTASLYLLIRCLSRRFHRTFSADDVVSSRHNNNDHILCFDHNSSASASQLLNSLPLFTFGSLTGNVAGGDCAVCLSKFEREDRLRLLPLCCHAFHAECIDVWLVSNQTCPLCRSSVHPTEAEILSKILSVSDDQRLNRNGNGDSNRNRNENSFRIEIGSISRRRGQFDSGRRSYSIGSFDYIVDGDSYEVSVGSIHQRGSSECVSADKESIPDPPGENVAADVASGGGGGGPRNWLRDYVRTLSTRTISFRGSGRFFTGSSRRNEQVLPVDDLEANRIGEEISELFRWLSGV